MSDHYQDRSLLGQRRYFEKALLNLGQMAPLEMVADPKIALSETASEAGGGVLIIWLQHLHCRGEPGPERVRRIILISCFAAASSPQPARPQEIALTASPIF